MSLRPYKFIVQAVPQQVDEDGKVVAELTVEPVVVFGCDELAAWANDFPKKLAETERLGELSASPPPEAAADERT